MIFAALQPMRVRRANAFDARGSATLRGPGPSDERQKFGEDHRGRSPYFYAGDTKCGRDDPVAVSLARGVGDAAGRRQLVDRDVENARDLAVSRCQRRTCVRESDDGVQAEAADGNVNGRERAGDAHEPAIERDFFVRLAQRRVYVRLAGV